MNQKHTPDYNHPHIRILKKHSLNRFSTRQKYLPKLKYEIPEDMQDFLKSQKSKSQSKPGFSPAVKPLKASRVSVLKTSPSMKRFDSTKERKIPLNMLTNVESQEIKKIIDKQLTSEIHRAKNRLNRRVDSMNRIGIMSSKANKAREESLLSVETSMIEQKIPKLTRIATSQVLLKRSQESAFMKNSRSGILEKMKNVIVRQESKTRILSNLKTSDEIRQYMDETLKNVEKYRVEDKEFK